MKKGLFFGSFNPIHIGHLIIAQYFAEMTDLDQVILVPSPQNPLKKQDELLPEEHRLKMVSLSVEGHPKIVVEDIEFSLPKPSYTYKTLQELNRKYKNDELVLLIGSDSLQSFHLWKNYKKILEEHKLYVYPRAGKMTHSLGEDQKQFRIRVFDAPIIEISSTQVRENKRKGISNRYLVYDKALAYYNNL